VAIPADRNVAQKKLKYMSACIAIRGMWNLKYKIMPVINGAAGIAKIGLRKNSEAIPEKHSTESLKKTVILRTSHVIWKVLQCETERWGSALVQEKYQEEKACDKRR
jgi:hypothetical protein